MREPKGSISVVMPTGKRMEAINNLSEAIKANAEATIALAKVIEGINPGGVTISGCTVLSGGREGIGISVGNEDDRMEQGVYHYSPTGYSEHDWGYPNHKKLKPNEEIPKCFGEEQDESDDDDFDGDEPDGYDPLSNTILNKEEEEDETYAESIATFDSSDEEVVPQEEPEDE